MQKICFAKKLDSTYKIRNTQGKCLEGGQFKKNRFEPKASQFVMLLDEMIQEADTIEEEDLDDGMIESDSADEFDQTIATHDVLEEPANAMIVISPTISTG